MTKISHIILLFSLILVASLNTAHANDSGYRDTRLEWDPITRAKSYDLEIYDSEKKLIIQKNVSDVFSEDSMIPGNYTFKIRSRDQRNVPGPWSPLTEFTVALLQPKVQGPAIEDLAVTESEEMIRLSWDPVPLAENYKVTISSTAPNSTQTFIADKNELTLPLKVNDTYKWTVEALNSKFESSSPSEAKTITLLPKKMPPVSEIKANISQLPAQLTWEPKTKEATYYYRISLLTEKGPRLVENGKTKKTSIDFRSNLPEGKYVIEVITKKDGFPDSETEKHNIKWNGLSRKNKRTVASDNEVEVNRMIKTRKSIERSEGYFMHASTLLSQLSYSSQNIDSNSNVNFEAAGAIARIGFGYEQPDTKLSFQTVFESAGYFFNNQIQNYFSLEGSTLFRTRIRTYENLKLKAGLTYKEQIDVSDATVGTGSNLFTFRKISYIGPHLGINYSYSLTPKIGLEGFTQLTASAISLDSPNDNAVQDSSEFRVGLLSSYKIDSQITGLLGYTYQEDTFQYSARTSTAGGNRNRVNLSGHFLHLLAEWNF